MTPKDFPERNIKIAEHQDEFITLPAYYNRSEGSMSFCFQLSEDEVNQIHETNEIWFKLYTGGQKMQPIFLSTQKEDFIGDVVKDGFF